jgi:diaminopimelate decarboxylase
MNSIIYLNKVLNIEQVKIPDIAAKFSTPCYCYSACMIKSAYLEFTQTKLKPLICFALKANDNHHILKILAAMGAGADCVSMNEIKKALKAGITVEKIVFSGVGKSAKEIEFAILTQILQINVESLEELLLIDEIAQKLGKKPRIALRINPNINAGTHSKITTGTKDDKFGISSDVYLKVFELAGELKNVEIVGISMHIGSQITTKEPFLQAFNFMKNTLLKLQSLGHHIKSIDLGGGVGVSYQPHQQVFAIKDYMMLIEEIFADVACDIIIEPGRAIIAKACVLLASVLYYKQTPHRNFLIIDAGMNNFLRPSLYNAKHQIIPVTIADEELVKVDIVGAVCESSDVFLQDELMPKLKRNDLVAILDTGAYGMVMSSNYNSRAVAAEVLVRGEEFVLIN